MFKEKLSKDLKEIFGIEKVTFDKVGDKFEQDSLFVEISQAKVKTGIGKFSAVVTGSIILYSASDKLPYGYFSNRIELAKREVKGPFVFLNLEENIPNSPFSTINLVERRVGFIYLFKAEHNPERGEISSLKIEGE